MLNNYTFKPTELPKKYRIQIDNIIKEGLKNGALSSKLLVLCFIKEARFELLNDFPLEKINTASNMLVLPDPFAP